MNWNGRRREDHASVPTDATAAQLLKYLDLLDRAALASLLLIDRHLKDGGGHVIGIRTAFAKTPAAA